MTLQEKARRAADVLCGTETGGGYKEQHEFAEQIVDAMVKLAREHADKALRSIAVVRKDISSARPGTWSAEINRTQFGIATETKANEWVDATIAKALRAAEEGEK